MSENMEGMTDAELNDIIFNDAPEAGVSDDHSVSPAIEESEEQPTESDVETDVDQTIDEDGDLDDDSTDEGQTDDSEEETDAEDDESEVDDTDTDEDKGTETDEKKPETKFQPLKANGKEYPIDDIGELYKLASAGVGAQQKYQAIAAHKKTIMAAEKAGVDIMEAVNLMANYKKNPQEAILKLLKENKIDPLDLDLDAENIANVDYSVSDFEVNYSEVVGEIKDSPMFPKVQELLLGGWDEASKGVFLENPKMIKNLHDEMLPMEGSDKSMFDLVSPIAEKMKLSGDNRSDYEIYMEARGKKVEEFIAFEKAKTSTQPPKAKVTKADKKKAAPTGGKGTGKPTLDFSAMSDADLDAFLEKA